jgi:2-succinyl-5-enolpyruvyl-6-hydroxy-3-cyclohexene-1-carboxylate synthase
LTLDAPNLNRLWADVLVEELVRSGVTQFFLAPGSRSTPLTTAVAAHPTARATMHYDERGTAFAALGYGRATGQPAGWITTSGTALANGFPAIVEAGTDSVPMVLLTADRPPELRDTAANQTIHQPGLYGDYVRWAMDVPPPSTDVPLTSILTMVDQAAHRAHGTADPGPVHLNLMYRKPLGPTPDGQTYDAYAAPVRAWAERATPWTTYAAGAPTIAPSDDLAARLQSAKRGVLIAGRMPASADTAAVYALAQHLGWPLLPDVGSQLQLAAPGADDPRCLAFDHVLARADWREALVPSAVVQFGGPPVSKRLQGALHAWQPATYALVHPGPRRIDPHHDVTHRIQAAPAAFARGLMDMCPRAASPTRYTESWKQANAAAEGALSRALPSDICSEPQVARLVAAHLPDGHPLVLASSMPVRDADRFARRPSGAPVPVIANRGASGIDGLVATAAGVAIGCGHPATLLIGDLALLHDLNSLALLQQAPVVVVVLNNDGGGIFHFLPIAEETDVFEPYFGTPHGMDFAHAAQQFGLLHYRPPTPEAFVEAYTSVTEQGTSALIEIRTDRAENHALHEALVDAVRSVDHVLPA